MIKKIATILLMGMLSVQGITQEKYVTRADDDYENYSFSPAIDIYKTVLDKGYVSEDLLKKLGNSYYFNADYKEAASIYGRLIADYGSEVGPEYLFRYAQTLKTLGKYGEAESFMTQFTDSTTDDLRATYFNEEKDYLEEIEKNSGRYQILPFEYNSPYSDFAPSYYGEGLIFASDRDTGNFARYRHTWNAKDFLDLYKVNADSVSFDKVAKLNDEINTRLHESSSITTKDGQTLYFTRNNFIEGKYVKDNKGVIRLKIFKADWLDGEWQNIQELPFNSDSYSVAHPALSPDGRTLFFSSDMPGTIGGPDLFKVSINGDGSFGTPINLGSTINTEARETFPFVTSEEVLYFSSDGHPGLGGLDVFATKIAEGNLNGRVVNVGKPVNGNNDDFTFIFDEGNRKGFFASNRDEGMGADDIYGFLETIPLNLDCDQRVSGTVRDKISNEVLVGATVKIINENNEEVLAVITDANGKYELTVDCNKGNFVRASIEGYVPSEEYLGKSEGKP
ncbi:MAG: carboxypeptidase regulatory-like domain-containing protein, partial [Bacteroidota bacterium]